MMTSHALLFAGLVVGFSVAVPIGPMGLLCIQRTLASGMRIGICTGLGAATVNVVYGTLVIVGLDRMAPVMANGGRVLSFAGGAYLLANGLRSFLRRATPFGQADTAHLSPAMAYGSAVAFNLTNPMAPVLILALLSPVVSVSSPTASQAAVLLLGMFTAAVTWWVCLSGGVSLLRSRLSSGMLVGVNQAAGAAMTFYGALALARSAGL